MREGLARGQWGQVLAKQAGAEGVCGLDGTGGPVQAGRLRHRAQSGAGHLGPDSGDDAVNNKSPQEKPRSKV